MDVTMIFKAMANSISIIKISSIPDYYLNGSVNERGIVRKLKISRNTGKKR
jgi:hypothetical protein